METYIVPVTFPDLDTAKRDASSLVDALRTAGLHAEMADDPRLESENDADRLDPGPTTRELHVHAESVEQVRERVRVVVDGQFPPGMVLLGVPTPL
ncbi:hypothetical protein [Georgenia ruanii]|uniref:hypothetical protein n=1 Tax=Georgenia ruanii TaxID=348442 RepID=UPI0012649396|nr:hypothetical protein [Georgenia ruanii]